MRIAHISMMLELEYRVNDISTLKKVLEENSTVFLPNGLLKIVPDENELVNKILPSFKNYIPRKFILEITEECTLRCKYCFYTNEKSLRKHSNNHISLDIAFKAIDYYYKMYTNLFKRVSIRNRKLVLKIAPPGISWWGGEPFTAFDIMKKSLDYFESLDWKAFGISKSDFKHSVATNFTILNNEITTFITKNKILLYISLDGMRNENDANRIFINGRGSYNTISKNLKLLIDTYPEYSKKHIIIQSVLTNDVDNTKSINQLRKKYNIGTNSQKIHSLVINEERTLGQYLTRFETTYTDYNSELSTFKAVLDCMRELPPSEIANFIDKNSIRIEFDNLFSLESNIVTDLPKQRNQYSLLHSCPIGNDVVFVSVSGDFHICNRVDYSHSLGNVNYGIDNSKIHNFFSEYHDGIKNLKCKNCWAIHFCNMCPGKILTDARFIYPNDNDCTIIKMRILIQLKKYIILSSDRILYRKLEKILYKNIKERHTSNKPVNILDYEKD